MPEPSPFLRIAHRGASAEEPEHTREALERAIALGADMIELDVQLTRDGLLAVVHDRELGRTLAGKGPVRERTMAELSAMDAGAWMGPACAGRPVLELAAVLDLVRGRAGLNVEIKSPRADWEGTARRIAAIAAPVDAERMIVSSFDWPALVAVRRELPHVRLGLLVQRLRTADIWRAAGEIGVWSIHVPWGLVTPSLVAAAHRRGLRVIAWTVNDPVVLQRLVDMRADGAITDDPRLFEGISFPGDGAGG